MMRKPLCPPFNVDQAARRNRITTGMVDRDFPDFEPLDLVAKQQAQMMRRNAQSSDCRWSAVGQCTADDICREPNRCQAACLLGNWASRGDTILDAHDQLMSHSSQFHLVTVVNWGWARDTGNLYDLKPRSMHRWLQRRIQHLKGIQGIACVEASLNTVGSIELWQGEINLVSTGASHQELSKALKLSPSTRVPKPVMIKAIQPGDLAHVLAYITKPLPEGRVAYEADNGRQRQRYVRVPSAHLREHDAWRMSMLMRDRLLVIGMRLAQSGTEKCR